MESPIEVLTRTAYGMLSSGAIAAGGPAPAQHRERRLPAIIRLARVRLPIRLRRRRPQ